MKIVWSAQNIHFQTFGFNLFGFISSLILTIMHNAHFTYYRDTLFIMYSMPQLHSNKVLAGGWDRRWDDTNTAKGKKKKRQSIILLAHRDSLGMQVFCLSSI